MTPDLFAMAYTNEFPRVVKAVAARGAGAELANEMAQAGFARGWERCGTLRQPERFVAFVRKIALNLYRDELRERVRLTDLESAREIGVRPEVNVEVVDLNRALKKCQPRQQLLLNEVYIQGRSTEELAQEIGVSKGALHHRLSRARRSLRKALEAA